MLCPSLTWIRWGHSKHEVIDQRPIVLPGNIPQASFEHKSEARSDGNAARVFCIDPQFHPLCAKVVEGIREEQVDALSHISLAYRRDA